MRVLGEPKFWAGVVVGYLVVVLFPAVNFRTMGRGGA